MTDHPESAYTLAVDWPDRERDTHPKTLAWAEKIEAFRDDQAVVVCPTCGPKAKTWKTCPRCDRTQPIESFNRNRSRPDGRGSWCAECSAAAISRWHARKAIAAIRRAS